MSSSDQTGPKPSEPTLPMGSGTPTVRVAPSGEQPGDFIGPYKLLELIGEGGFGTVWLAERREPMVQRVALKIIKPGMDSKAVIARFEQERQALALMDHPNIARVHDAGTTASGRPYFVMEHVKGSPITAYCDRARLTLPQRLELFARVCDAVQHAHTKGVIHRDLKPANILVAVADGASGRAGGEPRPVIIDFGVAKAVAARLTDRTIHTEQGVLIGTPEYMSPEQAEMAETNIDTRTDVYALGVILYELLTGVLPFDPATLRAAGYAAIQRIIREVDPPRPSTRLSSLGAEATRCAEARRVRPGELESVLRGELEWIPLKAMRKERSERYRTASELSDDIVNYLQHKPLIAGPESTSYRLRKFVRRNRAGVAAGAAVLATLVLGITATLWQAREAARERDALREAMQRNDLLQRESERQAAAQIALKRDTLAGTARASLKAAREHSSAGRLREAVLSLPEQLAQDLESYPELSAIRQDILHHRRDWEQLLEFKQKVFEVYSGTVNTFELGKIAPVDVSKLGEAAKMWLPNGLTEEGIKELRARLDASVYSPEERAQIGDGLMEWAVLGFVERFPIIYKSKTATEEVKAACPAALRQIEGLESLARACIGADGPTDAWTPALQFLRITIYNHLEDKSKVDEARRRRASVTNARGSSYFLVGIFAQVNAEPENIVLDAGLVQFPIALARDPLHSGAASNLTQLLYRRFETCTDEAQRRSIASLLVAAAQDRTTLQPKNAYAWANLTMACALSMEYEISIGEEAKRINSAAGIVGNYAATRTLELCQENRIEPSSGFYLAVGKLRFDSLDFDGARHALNIACSASPSDYDAAVLLACANAKSETLTNPGAAVEIAEKLRKSGPQLPITYVNLASLYSVLSGPAYSIRLNDQSQLRERAIECLQLAVSKSPTLSRIIARKTNRWFESIQTDPRYIEIVGSNNGR